MRDSVQRSKARDYMLRKRMRSGLPLIECLICHDKFRAMGSHLVKVHGIDQRTYKHTYSLDPLAAEDLRAAQSALVAARGLTAHLIKPAAVLKHAEAMRCDRKKLRSNETRNSNTAIDRRIEKLLMIKAARDSQP